jgi:hypothetical protein
MTVSWSSPSLRLPDLQRALSLSFSRAMVEGALQSPTSFDAPSTQSLARWMESVLRDDRPGEVECALGWLYPGYQSRDPARSIIGHACTTLALHRGHAVRRAHAVRQGPAVQVIESDCQSVRDCLSAEIQGNELKLSSYNVYLCYAAHTMAF